MAGMNISGKTIVITGASDGIGKSVAVRLAQQQGHLILWGRDETKLAEVRRLCEAAGSTVSMYAFDITNAAERDKATAEIQNTYQVDVLINNAGIWHKSTPLAELESELIESVISTNLTAHILTTKALLAQMRGRETVVLNVISSAGLQGRAGRTAYAASKFGMRGFSEALREETKDDPIRIGAIFQSGTNTQMFAKAGEDMPLDRYTDPDDLAEVVAFMLTRPPRLWMNEVHVVY